MNKYDNIMKELETEALIPSMEELSKRFSHKKNGISLRNKLCLIFGIFVFVCLGFVFVNANVGNMQTSDEVAMVTIPIASTAERRDVISIPTGVVKANPFVPYRKFKSDIQQSEQLINDVPKFDLIAPPEVMGENPEAVKILTTTVSGILYDKYSPSAILNIDGNDYLVKKGDTVNRYKIISIAKDSVTVKSGKNTYTAGIGEMLSDGTVHYNDISDLDKKFGGKR